jgi:hypothetical protein
MHVPYTYTKSIDSSDASRLLHLYVLPLRRWAITNRLLLYYCPSYGSDSKSDDIWDDSEMIIGIVTWSPVVASVTVALVTRTILSRFLFTLPTHTVITRAPLP